MTRYDLTDWPSKAQRYWPNVLMMVAAVASVATCLAGWWQGYSGDIYSVYIISVATALAVYIIRQEKVHARLSVYAEAVRPLHATVHRLRDGMSSVAAATETECTATICAVLNDLTQAFSIATRTTCRACVKVLATAPNAPDLDRLLVPERTRHLHVGVLARDSASIPRKAEEADFVSDNTDFESLFRDTSLRSFFSNNLPDDFSRGLYYNSHIEEGFDLRKDRWPLPYQATIVWPIRLLGKPTKLHPGQEILGFLCIDSPKKNVLVERHDFEMGALVADALYCYMRAFNESKGNSGGEP